MVKDVDNEYFNDCFLACALQPMLMQTYGMTQLGHIGHVRMNMSKCILPLLDCTRLYFYLHPGTRVLWCIHMNEPRSSFFLRGGRRFPCLGCSSRSHTYIIGGSMEVDPTDSKLVGSYEIINLLGLTWTKWCFYWGRALLPCLALLAFVSGTRAPFVAPQGPFAISGVPHCIYFDHEITDMSQ